MAGVGFEQPSLFSGNTGNASGCGADCSATRDKGLEVLARAVILVARSAIAEPDQAAVLARVIEAMRAQALVSGPDAAPEGPEHVTNRPAAKRRVAERATKRGKYDSGDAGGSRGATP